MRAAFLILLAGAAGLSACAGFGPGPRRPAPARGEAFVVRACAGCHAVAAGGASANPDAPPFRTLAARLPGATLDEALAAIARDGHVRMPPIYMTPDEQGEVAAYIRSLPPGLSGPAARGLGIST